jgi:hypothetical protein
MASWILPKWCCLARRRRGSVDTEVWVSVWHKDEFEVTTELSKLDRDLT